MEIMTKQLKFSLKSSIKVREKQFYSIRIPINAFSFLDPDHHLALYNRARTYRAMEQYDQALSDAVQVVTLKSQWAKVSRMCFDQ